MEPEVPQSPSKRSKKNIVLVSVIAASLLLLAAAAQFTYMTLKNTNVYKGVSVNGLNVGGLTRAELIDRLNKEYQDKINGLRIVLKTDRVTETASFTDLKASYEVEAAADRAYAIGRSGTVFDRIYDIIAAGTGGIAIDMPITYSKEQVEEFTGSFYDKTLIKVKEADVLIQDDRVTVRSGAHGESVDKNKISSEVESLIKERRGGIIPADVTITPPSRINVDDLAGQIDREPADAGFKIVNGKVEVVPHVVGRKIDRTALASVAAELETDENAERVLPVQFIKPQITTDDAHAKLFKDELAYMSTHFSTSTLNDKNRGENIKLAVSKINGRILAPGEVFSFNDIVGPRTAEGGYQTAHTYSAGKVVDGIGGGICQVSSTLYNAVLKADLNVVERRNHMFTVGYVPYGQDATVSYGTTDFRFSNSTRWPIKLVAGITKNNNVYFSFLGTNENPGKKVIITNQTVKKTPFTIKYIDDPTLPEGKQTILQEGKEGYVIDTFKTIKVDDKVISQTKLHTSKYQPLVQEVRRGTKKADATTPPAVVQPPVQPASPPVGVDDADNPPAPVEDAGNSPAGVDDADNPPAAE
jgi:vancomycin resistance protein YoaR